MLRFRLKFGKSLIFPLIIAILLGLLSGYWIYEYVSYDVAPRIGGQDGRPQIHPMDSPESGPTTIEGSLQQFDGTPSAIAGNWPMFRGSDGNGVIESDVSLARKWPTSGPVKLWEVQLGEGYAAPAVYNGCVYLIDYDMQAKADAIRCFSLDDGKEIWRYSYPVNIKRNHGMSRTVPAVNDKYVVTIGPKCHVTCLDAKTGQFRWMIDLVSEYGTKEPLWYAGQCPLIVDNQAIIAPAGNEVLMMAVDCQTGEIVWTCPNPQQWEMTHSSILPMRFADRDFYVYPGSRGLAGVSAEDGTLLWQTDVWYLRTNVPTPVNAEQGRIFLSAGYNKGSMMLQLRQQEDNIVPHVVFERQPEVFGSDQQTPIYYKGYIYGVRPDKQLVCLDMTGEVLWSSGSQNTYGLGPYMVANGIIYVLNDDGVLSLIEAVPDAFRLLDQAGVLDGHECWGPPALVAGRLLVRDLTTLVCLDVAAQ
ncbi:MAG: PQQ-binding-like beta-propeller repeat protein [Phycisphaerae bacterium]|nr:PQQ-binding-like beta-propeller repeat protein [Phycisphaerae bacterium]